MRQKRTAEDLERQLAALRLDLEVSKKQSQLRHAHLVNATRHLGKAIEELAKPREGQRT
jgi:hypothetical protein